LALPDAALRVTVLLLLLAGLQDGGLQEVHMHNSSTTSAVVRC
jgi:hypothetical protein